MTDRNYMQRVTYQHTIEYEVVNAPDLLTRRTRLCCLWEELKMAAGLLS